MIVKHDFLLEIGCEELPPKALLAFESNLKQQLLNGVTESGLSYKDAQSFAAPRRLAVLIQQLSDHQASRQLSRRGPALTAAYDKDGKPTQACLGFARSCGCEVDALTVEESDKGTRLVYRYTEAGKPTIELLTDIVNQALVKLPISKPMRWSSSDIEFIRPVHWILMLYGEDIVPGKILGISSDRKTYGHRFHYPHAIKINKPTDYTTVLQQQAYVIPDFASRKASIEKQLDAICQKHQAQIHRDEALLNEVTAIVEWPQALLANFAKEFLMVPAEALMSAMKKHQKCFPIFDADNNLLPHFITVSNIESKQIKTVIAGNERVMRARLADAAFFFTTDKQHSLESRIDRLKHITFQYELGSLYDKSQRITKLASYIAKKIKADISAAKRAGQLSKTDLCTDMVSEFPELQGIMGNYYAEHDGESAAVALALREQYLPRFSGDALPSTDIGYCLAIADRLDTIVGIFAINKKPKGDKDPFGLKRAAFGILRIIIEKHLNLDIDDLLRQAIKYYPAKFRKDNVQSQCYDFIYERLRFLYLDEGVAADSFNAVISRRPSQPYDFHIRIRAVEFFRKLPEAESLAAANKRVNNILKKSDCENLIDKFDQQYLIEGAEKNLAQLIKQKHKTIKPLFKAHQYKEALTQLASMKDPIDHLFDTVMIMAEDENVRQNRLALLASLRNLFLHVADISLLQS